MNSNKILLLLIANCVAIQVSSAVTIPAGTLLTVRTTNTISSRDLAGKEFRGELLESIPGKSGFSVAPGLGVVGVVQSPRVEIASSVRPLTLILTALSVEGRMIPMKSQPYEVHNAGIMGRGGRVRFTGGAFILPPGTVLQFRLRKAVTV